MQWAETEAMVNRIVVESTVYASSILFPFEKLLSNRNYCLLIPVVDGVLAKEDRVLQLSVYCKQEAHRVAVIIVFKSWLERSCSLTHLYHFFLAGILSFVSPWSKLHWASQNVNIASNVKNSVGHCLLICIVDRNQFADWTHCLFILNRYNKNSYLYIKRSHISFLLNTSWLIFKVNIIMTPLSF